MSACNPEGPAGPRSALTGPTQERNLLWELSLLAMNDYAVWLLVASHASRAISAPTVNGLQISAVQRNAVSRWIITPGEILNIIPNDINFCFIRFVQYHPQEQNPPILIFRRTLPWLRNSINCASHSPRWRWW